MVDRRSIVRQWQQGIGRVLVTLVRTQGSSYRRPGAHMLIGDHGQFAGTIGGGCLEAEVVRKAEWMARDGAVVQTYSTLFDDTAEIPFGLGCGGVVDLLLESVDTPECTALLAAMEASLAGQESTVATWLPRPGRALARVVLAADGSVLFASAGLPAPEMAELMAQPSDPHVYVERLSAPQRLFVFGAGDDARPMVTMASLLGWNVTVVDGRPQLARAERFPEADRVVVSGSMATLEIRSTDAAVVMTHNYEQDRAFLAELLRSAQSAGAGYIGLLGARHRSSLLVREVAALLGRSVAQCCGRLWAPVGLDLGGDGPEAIALAVVAEVQAWVQGRLGASRRLTAQDVAEQIERGGASQYLQAQCALEAAG